jgi:hypothetical protein
MAKNCSLLLPTSANPHKKRLPLAAEGGYRESIEDLRSADAKRCCN